MNPKNDNLMPLASSDRSLVPDGSESAEGGVSRADDFCDDFDDEGDDNSGCYECGGRGYVVRCIDDLCYGQDECIHGDPPEPCRTCNPKGEREDAFC